MAEDDKVQSELDKIMRDLNSAPSTTDLPPIPGNLGSIKPPEGSASLFETETTPKGDATINTAPNYSAPSPYVKASLGYGDEDDRQTASWKVEIGGSLPFNGPDDPPSAPEPPTPPEIAPDPPSPVAVDVTYTDPPAES